MENIKTFEEFHADESAAEVNEAKNDYDVSFTTKQGRIGITIKNGHKFASEDELAALYDTIGKAIDKSNFPVATVVINTKKIK